MELEEREKVRRGGLVLESEGESRADSFRKLSMMTILSICAFWARNSWRRGSMYSGYLQRSYKL